MVGRKWLSPFEVFESGDELDLACEVHQVRAAILIDLVCSIGECLHDLYSRARCWPRRYVGLTKRVLWLISVAYASSGTVLTTRRLCQYRLQ